MKFILTRNYQSLLVMILQFVTTVKLFYAYISVHIREPGFTAEHSKCFTSSSNATFHNKVRPMFWMESSSVEETQNLKETNHSLSRQIYTLSDTHNKIIECHFF